MRFLLSITLLIALTALASGDKRVSTNNVFDNVSGDGVDNNTFYEVLKRLMIEKKMAKFNLGFSKQGKAVEAYFFPGSSNKNALVLGGVHGSELSSIEVASTLVQNLTKGDALFYNTIVIPSLFPDNAEMARRLAHEIGSPKNIGRYSFPGAPDPNRQMPTPGNFIDEDEHTDHAGRQIETENVLLIQLIKEFRPQRIASLHAIRNTSYAGFFADPRTDERGTALGYETDSSLAVFMAQHVHERGGYAPGNRLPGNPTALYYKDPLPAAKGNFQKRNFTGSPMPGYKGSGISLGTWASTAVKDKADPSNDRDAIRIITIEFPGSQRPIDHTTAKQKGHCSKLVQLYAQAIQHVFLQEYFVEPGNAKGF